MNYEERRAVDTLARMMLRKIRDFNHPAEERNVRKTLENDIMDALDRAFNKLKGMR